MLFVETKPKSYGLSSRVKIKSECDEFELSRIISENTIEDIVYVNLPADYIIEDITEEVNVKLNIQAKIQKGREDRRKCETVLDLIAGYNRDRQLSIEQITQMQQTFAQAESMLRASRPDFAKQIITSITPDGVLITQEMKDICLSIL
jgi:hypothetical protein